MLTGVRAARCAPQRGERIGQLLGLVRRQVRGGDPDSRRAAKAVALGALGGLVAAHGLDGFVVLFLANALTYVLYVVILVRTVRQDARPALVKGGYRLLIRDRPLPAEVRLTPRVGKPGR